MRIIFEHRNTLIWNKGIIKKKGSNEKAMLTWEITRKKLSQSSLDISLFTHLWEKNQQKKLAKEKLYYHIIGKKST